MEITDVSAELWEYFLPLIRNGIEFLDEKHPDGWRDKVRPASLDMKNPHFCVIGQVEGDFHEFTLEHGLGDAWAHEHGFNVSPFFLPRYIEGEIDCGEDGDFGMPVLTALWRRELTRVDLTKH